jgi:hypothetical protein
LAHLRPKGIVIHFSPACANNTIMIRQPLITEKVVQSWYEFTVGEVTRGAKYNDGRRIRLSLFFAEITRNDCGMSFFIENSVLVHIEFHRQKEIFPRGQQPNDEGNN